MKHLDEMVVFARVVEFGGFSAAARRLGMTTSAVSRSVSRLESHIGGRLLNRSTRAISVTELGRKVHTACAAIAETAREIEAFAGHYAGTPSGRLKISAPVAHGRLCVLPVLCHFLDEYPEIEVQLDLTERIVDVVGESYDVAIRAVPSLPPGMVARPLMHTRTILVASPRYLSIAGAPSDPSDIAAHAGVYTDIGESPRELILRQGATERRTLLPARMTINDSSAIVAAVLDGRGIGIVADYAAAAGLRDGSLVPVLPEWAIVDPRTNLMVHAIYSPTRHLPRKVRAFIDYFVGHSTAEPPRAIRPLPKAA